MTRKSRDSAGLSLLIALVLAFWACATQERREAPNSELSLKVSPREEVTTPTCVAAASQRVEETSQNEVLLSRHAELSTSTEIAQTEVTYVAANLMSDQLSSYLKSLTTSPVHWHPWSREHLDAAEKLDRPLLVSVGVSWSLDARRADSRWFADPKVADLVNEKFVPIKLDADEHPEVAERYRLFYSILRQRPAEESLVVIALPSGVPFEAAAVSQEMTAQDLITFLTQIEQVFRTNREAATAQAQKFSSLAQYVCNVVMQTTDVGPEIKEKGKALQESVLHSGVGNAGKQQMTKTTPCALQAMLALQHYSDTRTTSSLETAQKLLQEMYRSSLRDPVFGGYFHRVAADGTPLGGKLLVDQAYLLRAFTWAFAATGKKIYREAAEEILRFLRDTFEAPDGGFYSSQELDYDPSHEMAYFTWSAEEILASELDDLEKQIILKYYGLDEKTAKQKVLLKPARTLAAVAEQLKRSPDTVQKALDSSRRKLREWRYGRDEFPRVNKAVIISWSAVTVSAYCDAWRYLGDEQARDFALRSASRILNDAASTTGLAHYVAKGISSQTPAILDDYVSLAEALLDCAEVSGRNELIRTAVDLMEYANRHFASDKGAPYRDCVAPADNGLLKEVPVIPLRDGLLESPNAAAVRVYSRLYTLTHEEKYRQSALLGMAPLLVHDDWWDIQVCGYARAVSAVAFPLTKAVIVGGLDRADTNQLWRAAVSTFRPGKSVQILTPEAASQTDYRPAKDGNCLLYT
ncbi:MAG: DUF255 domain-containing protein, partial [Candidatus Sumerlaeaceae bacterium]|nr:DUF255 domain-containing protein [Candidatus Sumerlaeaceae bacterium]